jgi:hypothetical protein
MAVKQPTTELADALRFLRVKKDYIATKFLNRSDVKVTVFIHRGLGNQTKFDSFIKDWYNACFKQLQLCDPSPLLRAVKLAKEKSSDLLVDEPVCMKKVYIIQNTFIGVDNLGIVWTLTSKLTPLAIYMPGIFKYCVSSTLDPVSSYLTLVDNSYVSPIGIAYTRLSDLLNLEKQYDGIDKPYGIVIEGTDIIHGDYTGTDCDHVRTYLLQ